MRSWRMLAEGRAFRVGRSVARSLLGDRDLEDGGDCPVDGRAHGELLSPSMTLHVDASRAVCPIGRAYYESERYH